MKTEIAGTEHDALLDALEDATATLTLVDTAAHRLGAGAGTAAASLAQGPYFAATIELQMLKRLLVAAYEAIDRCQGMFGPSSDSDCGQRSTSFGQVT